ncbi:MAG: hybrid sensor histidine kinase/response regulator, partial [Tannerellaceae bacterium]|nr:hybrid sensor histidine kinase/response regulator [Tannerellaceae bacterium]
MRKALTFYLVLICIVISLTANENTFYFSSLDMKDGLSQLSVMNIFQDSEGFMWFGTRNGLNKYDGTGFIVYKHTHTDPFSLCHNHISALGEDKSGNLWIGTIGGLNRMDRATSRIISYNNQDLYPENPLSGQWIFDLFSDNEDNLWIATATGLFRYDPEKDQFHPLENHPLQGVSVTKVKQIRSGEFFLGTSTNGLYVCDRNFTVLAHYHKDSPETPLIANNVYNLYEDSRGFVWVGTRHNGLNKIDLSTGQVKTFTKAKGTLGNDNVRCICEYDNKLIVGTFDGLSILHPETDSLEIYTRFAPEKGGLSNFSIYSMYVDPANTLWIGSYSGGINFTNPVNSRFLFHDLHTQIPGFQGILGPVRQQADGTIWLASEGSGLIEWDRSKGLFTQHLLEPFSIHRHERSFVKSLLIEGDIIWCGTQKGTLYQFDTRTKTFRLIHDFQQEIGIYTIVRSADNILWVGTTASLYAFHPDGTIQDRFLLRDSSYITFPSIRCFREISRNVFLIGTHHGGLYRYNAQWGSVEHFHSRQTGSNFLFADYVTDIWVDEMGKCWIGTFGGGLCQYDDERGIRRIYTTEDGLPDDNIYSIVADKNRKLWLSTGNGLSCFDPATGIFTNYSSWEEIEVAEFSLKGGSRLPDRDQLLFTGSNGFVLFEPDKLADNTFLPPVAITSFSVNNRPVVPGDGSGVLYMTHPDQPGYIVKYNQNNFSIRYAALNYLYPHQNRYRYKLDGYDMEWNDVGTRNEAFYTNLTPGEYTFRVKGSNNDGVWSDTETTLQIRILFPWWQRWYAIAGYIILVILITYSVFSYFHTRRKLEKDLQAKRQEQERQ